MTNEMIIGNAQDALLRAGKIKPTGRMLRAVDGAGNEITVPEAEPIHTYQTWRELGFRSSAVKNSVFIMNILSFFIV